MDLRKVGPDAFDEIYPLLRAFRNRRMSKEDWRRMLFSYPWAEGSCRGFAMYAYGRPVGFLGAILSQRPMLGKVESFCNFSSWIVEEGYRGPSALMLRSVVKELDDHTLVGHTPATITIKLFSLFGFRQFEREQLLLFPWEGGGMRPLRALGGSVTRAPDEIEHSLSGVERTIQRDLSGSRAKGVLLRRGRRQCYVVVRRAEFKRLPVSEILYMGDGDFFWENRMLVHAALLITTGTAIAAVDSRMARGRRLRFVHRFSRPRIYRPARPEITPMEIDGLYSELTMLRGVDLSD
jgi:hypothetical protein